MIYFVFNFFFFQNNLTFARKLFAGNNAQGIIAQALFLGDQTQFNASRDDCIWKRGNERDECQDEDINVYLYTEDSKNPETVSIKINTFIMIYIYIHYKRQFRVIYNILISIFFNSLFD